MEAKDPNLDEILKLQVEENDQDSQEVKIIKELISIIQGAPYPTNIEDELYTIWYEHALHMISDAYFYVDKVTGRDTGEEPVIP